MLLEAKNFS